MMFRAILSGLVSAMVLSAETASHPLTFEDLASLQRLSDPQPSPDGRWIACVVTTPDLGDNRTDSDIWLVPAAGGTPRKCVASPKHARHPRWSPDGRWLVFESNRDGEFQVWVQAVEGGEARAITRIATGASAPVWSPDGSRIAFLSSVYPEFSGKSPVETKPLNRARHPGAEKGPAKARVEDPHTGHRWCCRPYTKIER